MREKKYENKRNLDRREKDRNERMTKWKVLDIREKNEDRNEDRG
jgi:hypothetical protein